MQNIINNINTVQNYYSSRIQTPKNTNDNHIKNKENQDEQALYSYEDKVEISHEGSKKQKLENKKKKEVKDKKEIERLKQRDAHVKQHEQAHVNAGGSNPQYKYDIGPDGKKYAVSGTTDIEMKKSQNPKETIANAEKVKRAALAPSDPSSQDKKIAAKADKMKADAQAELRKKDKSKKEDDKTDTDQTEKNNLNTFGKKSDNEVDKILRGYSMDKMFNVAGASIDISG